MAYSRWDGKASAQAPGLLRMESGLRGWESRLTVWWGAPAMPTVVAEAVPSPARIPGAQAAQENPLGVL